MEGDAGAGPVTPAPDPSRRPPGELGDGWLVGGCVALLLLAAGLGVAGVLSLRSHESSRETARHNAAALAAARECVLATQAPDVADIDAAAQKIFDCTTGEFRTQATMFAEMFVHAYRAAKVQVAVTEMAAAVERDNPDGSVDVLVAFRIKVDNVEAQGREVGYRLRTRLVCEDNRYRIANLDQVSR